MFDKYKSFIILLILSSVLIGTFSVSEVPVHAYYLQASDPDSQIIASQDPINTLPLVLNQYSGTSGIQQFGVGLEGFSDDQLNRADEANAYWVRQDVFNWDEIEPNPPIGDTHTYYWDSVDEAWLQDASSRGLKIIAVIKHTPYWAQKYEDYSCGPVKKERLGDFADFIAELVGKYGNYIKYWEIGNEPDVNPYEIPWTSGYRYEYGCWGASDEYYGGTYYGEMLSYVYPAIKEADPYAKVLVGGLLLDCEPEPYVYVNGYTCKDRKAGKFFEGILRYEDPDDGDTEYDGWKYFDIIPYHGFNGYFVSSRLRWDEITSKPWHHRGGHVLGKADFLREVMGEYGVEKPIMLNETALLCYDVTCDPTPSEDFIEAKAEYVVWVNVRNMATDILGTVWHTLPNGWRHGGLIENGPTPAYYSFQFMAEELRNADFYEKTNEEIGTCSDLRAYKFLKGGSQIWVMWTGDETNCDFTLPAGTSRVFDIFGNDITPSGGELTIRAPVYVEIPLGVYLPLVLKNN